ncbi:hypothetical protein [Variovorax sp. J31P207]|uniref:hypothetical protein n=1 Tax=Variovorax sp. J31P207 TaxID=3053510 RepID=UPI0025762B2B|nr:hypothetical protein [Variovorax sp. J31P207]MDM0066838.1 hypothetical protein [Variovorax sp. J31P207]
MEIGNQAGSSTQRIAVGFSQLAIVAFTLLDLTLTVPHLVWGIAAASALFIVLEGRAVPAGIRRTALILFGVSLVLLPVAHSPVAAMERGIRVGGLIASLLLSVALLSKAAQRVQRFRNVIMALLSVPAPQRFATVTVATQFFGGMLGFAGVAMMMESAADLPMGSTEERAACFGAITRGYAAANLWSPMFSNVSILLAISPGLAWATVFPFALLLAAVSIGLGIAVHRVCGPRLGATDTGQVIWRMLLRASSPVLAGMLGFLVCVMLLSKLGSWPAAASIILLAPLGAWGLNLFGGPKPRSQKEVCELMLADARSLRSLVTEVMLLLASGCAGTVIASAIPPAWTDPVMVAISPYPILGCFFLAAGVLLMSSASVHPLLSAIVVASAFHAEALGLSPIAHLLAVLCGLGLAVIVTPFSVVSLTASRFSGLPLLTVSVRSHVAFAAVKLLLVALLLGGLSAHFPH